VKIAAIVLVAVGLCATLVLLSYKPSPSSDSAAVGREKPFLSLTISYFDKFKDQASTVVLAMTDASDLDALKRTFQYAKSDEMTLYTQYSERRSALTTTVQEIADKTDNCHLLFQQGLSEMLRYWEDRDPTRIPRGSNMVKGSMTEANDILAKIAAPN
jgi:hypothetical protein